MIVINRSNPDGQVVHLTPQDILELKATEPDVTVSITFQPWERPVLMHASEYSEAVTKLRAVVNIQ